MVFDPEKTISEIFFIFCEDEDLESFDIIPEPKEKDEPPVRHVEHNMGLESWCVKNLYTYTHCQIFTRSPEIEKTPLLLTTASLLNPNSKTFWNMRRKLVLSNDLNVYSELRFVALVVTFKPKVPDVFNYRKWILQQIFETKDIRTDLFSGEFRVVLSAAERFTNNHMAWDFAVWLLDWIELDKNADKVLEYFWNQSKTWISSHVSDYSAMNFRQQLIKKLLDSEHILHSDFKFIISKGFQESLPEISKSNLVERNVDMFYKFGIITSDFELNEKLICFFVNHEALWNHRRYLCYLFAKVLPQKVKKNQNAVKILNEFMGFEIEDFSDPFRSIFFKIQDLFLSKISANNQKHFVQGYLNWLKYLNILNDDEIKYPVGNQRDDITIYNRKDCQFDPYVKES